MQKPYFHFVFSFTERTIVVILCNEGKRLTYSEEESITATIVEFLGEKGVVFWWKKENNTKRSSFSRSRSLTERSRKPEECTLVLKTRLRRGIISYDKKDVRVRVEGWTAPQEIVENLLRNWQTTNNVELSVYCENKTGSIRAEVTEHLESRMSGLEESLKGAFGPDGLLSSVWETNAIGAGVTSLTKGTDVINVRANVFDAFTLIGSNLMSGSVAGTEATGSIGNEDGPPDGKSNI